MVHLVTASRSTAKPHQGRMASGTQEPSRIGQRARATEAAPARGYPGRGRFAVIDTTGHCGSFDAKLCACVVTNRAVRLYADRSLQAHHPKRGRALEGNGAGRLPTRRSWRWGETRLSQLRSFRAFTRTSKWGCPAPPRRYAG